ncbi:MAG: UDP-N-acetylglucosamine pyrophosphorylase [Clostridia bacterium]|nr:UDP-N-acetylglucosamine pyrophosphorylase [Clostridia bacterium]
MKEYEALKITSLYRHAEHSLASPVLARFVYPWEALEALSGFLLEIGETLPGELYEKRGESVWVAKSAVVAPGASILGPCIVGERAELRPGAFVRGSVLIGADAVVGNSTELKNCILFDGVQVPHYNYVGDSILGYRAHMGAGAITSNVKSDKSLVTVDLGDERVETRRKKCGAMLGDFVEVGCNSVLNPGTVIGVCSNVYPLSSVRGFVPANSIYKSRDQIVRKETQTPS